MDRRKKEAEDSKKKRMQSIIEAASHIFCIKGIDNSKVTDIAEAAEVGVASVYRYFKTKSDIVLQVGIKFWQDIKDEFVERINSEEFQDKNGIEQVKEVGEFFLKLYNDYPEFLQYLHDFDSYVVKENIEKERLKEYEKNILLIEEMIIASIKKGQEDKTIKSDISAEELYVTTTHTLMCLVQKLALSGSVLESDCSVDGEKQIKMVIDMVLNYINNK